jgi:putative peptidoglycan lipid II flippase
MFAGGVLGKGLGLVREITLAATFGAGPAAAAFRAAQTATLVPTHSFASDSLNGGFIPLCARYLRDDPQRARTLYWSVSALLGAISIVLAFVLFFTADVIVSVLVPGLSAETRALTAAMLRAMAVGVPFYVQASLVSYAEMAAGRYIIGSIRSAVQNIGLIAGIVLAALLDNPLLLGWGFTAYSVLFALAGCWSLARYDTFAFTTRLSRHDAFHGLREFGRLVRPLLLLPLLQQGAFAIERMVASLISLEAVASIDYARAIADTGLVLLAVPLGMAGLAELARLDAAQSREKLERLLPALLLVTVPFSLYLAVNAEPLVRLVFARGRFDESAVALTSLVLTGFAVGFWAQASGHVLSRALSAHGRNRRVALIIAFAAAAHIAINLLAFRFLGALALGLAASASGWILLAGTMRALSLQKAVFRSLVPLGAGAVIYVPVALYFRGPSIASMAGSLGLLALCILPAVAMSSLLRATCGRLFGPISAWIRDGSNRRLAEGRTS